MTDFLASLGPFGWIVIALAGVGLATLPTALREMMTRPWSKDRRNGHDDAPGSDDDHDR